MRSITYPIALPILGIALASAVGCGSDMTPRERLVAVRILAAQAEPVNPAPGQTTTLTPLAYAPNGESVSFSWSWCPLPTNANDGYQCPIDQAGLDQLTTAAGLSDVPPLDLGTGDTMAFTNPFPTTLTAALCANDPVALSLFLASSHRQGTLGTHLPIGLFICSVATLPVQVKVKVTGPSGSDVGVFHVNLPIDDTTPANQNPILRGVLDVTDPLPLLIDESATVIRPTGSKVKLSADMDESIAEEYLDKIKLANGEYQKDGRGAWVLGPTRERITVSWFAEGGESGGFEDNFTGFNPTALDANKNPIPFDMARKMTWTVPNQADYAASTLRLILVVRDNRGGTAWTTGVMGIGAGK